jgi:hypothetical protein
VDIARADGAYAKLGGLISPRASQDRCLDPESSERNYGRRASAHVTPSEAKR